ncbi:hypothetical protein BOO69_08305 [Sulfitobacter alexandrii]|uniref:Uncharacterized protein n=1 Tax=Sulfitobacter alexandrii TaxID=1917485 RepID=A0A1J0WGI3_9RHOB|nr:hypothetical protein [Sulfitobacter alexandrii]APE43418.1 hypothetical protein BOO69_08305 [Sulfitobacter alexandrii]
MTFFPAGFDPRDDRVALLDLVEVDTPDGPGRFLIGVDGVFRDVDGNQWIGSQLVAVNGLKSAIDGIAPEGTATLSYFQDPEAANLIAQLRALGSDYIAGRKITFYVQPLQSMSEFYAPTLPPVQWMQRVMKNTAFAAQGALDRSISLTFEAWSEYRRSARRIAMNTEGHARLTGAPNPSLEFAPTVDFQEEKLFG